MENDQPSKGKKKTETRRKVKRENRKLSPTNKAANKIRGKINNPA